eukprot:COSAG04_NODE_1349_length_7133_cov_9.163918_2_plen_82_part_00
MLEPNGDADHGGPNCWLVPGADVMGEMAGDRTLPFRHTATRLQRFFFFFFAGGGSQVAGGVVRSPAILSVPNWRWNLLAYP